MGRHGLKKFSESHARFDNEKVVALHKQNDVGGLDIRALVVVLEVELCVLDAGEVEGGGGVPDATCGAEDEDVNPPGGDAELSITKELGKTSYKTPPPLI